MRNLKRVLLPTALALAAIALTTATASADIEDSNNPGVPYTGPFYAEHNGKTGADPTFTAGSVVISCGTATLEGTIDGDWDENDPASGVLDFAWSDCATTAGTNHCTFDPVFSVPVDFIERSEPAPAWEMVNTGRLETFVDCTGGVFSCDMWSDPADGTAVTADVDSATQILHIDDTIGYGGSLACPSSLQWEARYQIVVRPGVDDPHGPLLPTGTQ